MTEDRVPSRRFMRGASARPRTRLGVGLVGLGRLGRIYARDLAARIPDVRLTAVADTDPAVLDLIACEYDVSRAHPDPAGLIRDPVVDAIVIASRAISTDILKFRARVLVIHVAERRRERATLITVLPMYSFRPRRSASPGQSSQAPAWRVLVVGRRSTDRDQAAASIAGHVRQAADRLASTRARRAAAARDVRSAGTVSPVPKYISSGVCPRNAECGSTWLCSWT
jgi:Oxidoreductase family, NAD-binding Rossmann fold